MAESLLIKPFPRGKAVKAVNYTIYTYPAPLKTAGKGFSIIVSHSILEYRDLINSNLITMDNRNKCIANCGHFDRPIDFDITSVGFDSMFYNGPVEIQ